MTRRRSNIRRHLIIQSGFVSRRLRRFDHLTPVVEKLLDFRTGAAEEGGVTLHTDVSVHDRLVGTGRRRGGTIVLRLGPVQLGVAEAAVACTGMAEEEGQAHGGGGVDMFQFLLMLVGLLTLTDILCKIDLGGFPSLLVLEDQHGNGSPILLEEAL